MGINQGVSGSGGGGGGIDGPSFHAYIEPSLSAYSGSGPHTVLFQNQEWSYPAGTPYSPSTGQYTAPESGVYLVTSTVADLGGSVQAELIIVINFNSGTEPPFATNAIRGGNAANTTSMDVTYVTAHVNLTAGDTVEIQCEVFGGTMEPAGLKAVSSYTTGGQRSFFTVARVSSLGS